MKRIAWIGAAAVLLVAATSGDPAGRARRDFPVATGAAKSADEAVFRARCQYCHLDMGMGTLTLMKRTGPATALLANRTDLDGEYIRTIVRHGLNAMPSETRAEVTDAELDAIVRYLTRNNPKGAQ